MSLPSTSPHLTSSHPGTPACTSDFPNRFAHAEPVISQRHRGIHADIARGVVVASAEAGVPRSGGRGVFGSEGVGCMSVYQVTCSVGIQRGRLPNATNAEREQRKFWGREPRDCDSEKRRILGKDKRNGLGHTSPPREIGAVCPLNVATNLDILLFEDYRQPPTTRQSFKMPVCRVHFLSWGYGWRV